MIEATNQEVETTKFVKINFKDFLITIIGANGQGSTTRRIQKFCRKYGLSPTEYQYLKSKICKNDFQVMT